MVWLDLGLNPGLPGHLRTLEPLCQCPVKCVIIGLGVRVFANGPGDLGSIPGRVIPKTQKMVLDASLLSTQHYKVRIKGKVEQSRKGVAPSPTHWCSSYRKGSLRVTLDYGRQLYLHTSKIIKLWFTWQNLSVIFCHYQLPAMNAYYSQTSYEQIWFVCLFWLYGISTFVGYLMLNPLLYK